MSATPETLPAVDTPAAAGRGAPAESVPAPLVRHLGLTDYEPTWRAMQRFTEERGADTAD